MSDPLPDWPDQPDAPPDIGVEEATAYWKGRGIADGVVQCMADPYLPCLPDWVGAVLAPSWKDLLNKYGIHVGPILDCDDHADGCRWWSHIVTAKAGGLLPPAFFYFSYIRGENEVHAICGCMWRDGDRSLLVNFFEPQPTVVTFPFAEEVLKPVTLTDDEVKSALTIRY